MPRWAHSETLIEAAGAGIVQALSLHAQLASGAPLRPDHGAAGPDVSALYRQKPLRAARTGAFVDFLEHLFQKP